jgi:SAM-dependent methyltransferase
MQFDLLQCHSCSIVFLFPFPSEALLTAMYAHGYHSHVNAAPTSNCLFRAIRYGCLLPYRLRYGSQTGTFAPFGQGRLLDVGCGTGDYLVTMASLGWKCSGIDVSETALSLAHGKVPGAKLHRGTVENAPFPRQGFEVVTLWHTLEHLPDPLKALDRIHDLLAPAGRLLVAVPNIDSFEAKVLGSHWLEMDIPGHLYYFSLKTLRTLLEKAGFKCAQSRPQIHPSTVSDSLDFYLDDLLGVRQSRQRRWLYYMLFPLIAASYAFGNWGCIELAAVKASAEGPR